VLRETKKLVELKPREGEQDFEYLTAINAYETDG